MGWERQNGYLLLGQVGLAHLMRSERQVEAKTPGDTGAEFCSSDRQVSTNDISARKLAWYSDWQQFSRSLVEGGVSFRPCIASCNWRCQILNLEPSEFAKQILSPYL